MHNRKKSQTGWNKNPRMPQNKAIAKTFRFRQHAVDDQAKTHDELCYSMLQ